MVFRRRMSLLFGLCALAWCVTACEGTPPTATPLSELPTRPAAPSATGLPTATLEPAWRLGPATATATPPPVAAAAETPLPSPTRARASSPTESEFYPTATAEALLEEDFDDEIADGWQVSGGAWGIREREYEQSSVKGGSTWSYHPGVVARDYGIEADFRLVPQDYDSADRRTAGLAVRMTNTDNFYMAALNWPMNTLTLYEVVRGEWELLASRTFALEPDTWYRLRLVARGPFIRAYVNGALQLEASGTRHTEGFAALRTHGGHFRIDNVRIEAAPPLTSPPEAALPFSDDFSDGDSDGWLKQNGTWRVVDSALEQSYRGAGEVWVFRPDISAADYRAAVRFRLLPSESDEETATPGNVIGLALRMSGISNIYWGAVDLQAWQVRISVRKEGAWTLLGSRPLGDDFDPTTWHSLVFEAEGPHLRLHLDDAAVLEATDRSYTAGNVGILINRGRFLIDDVRVEAIAPATESADGAPTLHQLPFRDSFEAGLSDSWALSGGGWAVIDGTLDQAQYADGTAASAWVDIPSDHYAVTANVRLVPEDYQGQHGRWIGLLIRRQGPMRGYWAVVNARDNLAQIWLGTGEGWRALSATAPITFEPDGWNTLRFEAYEDQLRFRFNGDLVVSATDSAWTEGGFGVRILEGHFQIDEVYVEEIDR